VPLCMVQHVIIIQGPSPNVEVMSEEAKVMAKHPNVSDDLDGVPIDFVIVHTWISKCIEGYWR
jgi:hypothetical protein